jgi:plasmid maintenance system antidote protein VapI
MTPKQLRDLRARPVASTGNRLAEAFEITERSQVDCVRATKFTAQYVSDMVRGRFQNISLDNAHKFADYFGCAIEDIFPSREAVAS